uniref:Retrotransposon gag domain-containing protein n=1 Tax=Fagus sylvatica TaxID=28930 RepID=A0A2N9H0A9_FAGSY
MAGETSGPGPIEQEIRMVALERKFDELLSFVQLIARRNLDGENQRKEDDKDANDEEPEGHSNANTTPPPPHQQATEARSRRGKTPSWTARFNSLGGKDQARTGFELFRKHRLLQYVLVPQHDGAAQVQGPRIRKTFQDTLTGHAAEWYSQLKKISHWKELADTFLAQYGFNSQIAPDWFDLQRMEKKSNETFRRICPKFFVDLIPVGERIEDAVKMKKIVEMMALMALAEQAAKKALTKKKEGDVQMIGRSNGRPRQVLPTFTMQPIQPRPTPISAPTQVPAPAPTPQMPARPAGNQVNNNRLPRKEPRQFTPLPMPLTELYPILIEKNLISPIVPETLQRTAKKGFRPKLDLGSGRLVGSSQWPSIVEAPISHLEGARTHHPIRSTTGAINRGYNIVEDEMDLNDLLDEEEPRGYYIEEDDTDEWRSVDFSELLQFPYLIVPRGFETPEFEIFYENVTCEGSGKSQPSEHPT